MIRPTVRRAALVAALAALPLSSAFAETRIEKNLALEAGGKLVVESCVGHVEVTGRSSPGAHVLLVSTNNDFSSRFDVAMEEHPGEVRVSIKKKEGFSGWTSWFRSTNVTITIDVPVKTRTSIATGGGHLELTHLEGDSVVETSGGHIEVKELEGDLAADTSGGHIAIEGISGDAKVETSGGHITANKVGGDVVGNTSGGHIEVADVRGNITVETSGGHIEIDGARGVVNAHTSGGSVEVEFAKGNGKGGTIESSGGGIRVVIDPDVDLTIDASSGGGSVSSDVPLKVAGKLNRSHIKGTIGKGGPVLTVHTSGGSIEIVPIGKSAVSVR